MSFIPLKVLLRCADALYDARMERNLTQEQAAELLDISVRWYQKLESGRSVPNFQLTYKITEKFGINLIQIAEEVELK